MLKFSYSSPKTEVRDSKIDGKGLFATQKIFKGEIIAIKSGRVVDKQTLDANKAIIRGSEMQIADEFFLAPLTEEDLQGYMIYVNHSCEPNLGVDGQITVVAMRDIPAEEEITMDYAMHQGYNMHFDCKCSLITCRKIITGEDWKDKKLQAKYGSYFSTYLLEKMKNSS